MKFEIARSRFSHFELLTSNFQPVLWSNGYDTCFTRRKRWFDSIRDYLHAQVRQSAERLGLNPSVCRFDSCSGYSRSLNGEE